MAQAGAASFPQGQDFYLLEIGPAPNTAAPISYVVSSNPDGFQVGKGYVKKKLGGPYHSTEEVRTASRKLTIVSIGPTQASVYDANGKLMGEYIVMLDPSSGSDAPVSTTPSKGPLTGTIGMNKSPEPPRDRFALPESPEAPFTIVEIKGTIVILRGTKEITLKPEDAYKFKLRWDDMIDANADSRIRIKAPDGEIITIDEYTDHLTLGQMSGGKPDLKQKSGSMQIESGPGSSKRAFEGLQVHTPVAGGASDGTKWRSQYDRNKQAHRFDVYEGKVKVVPTNTSLKPRLLTPGKWCIVYPDHIEPPDPASEIDDSALHGLAMETRTVRSGTQLTMPVLLKGIPSGAAGGLGNVNFEVTYDPSVVAVKGNISRGNVISGMSFEANPGESGRIRIGFAGAHGATQTGTVAQIPFEVRGQPGQQTALTIKILQSQASKGQAVTLATTNGKIIIASSNVAAGGASGPGGEHLAPSSGHVSPSGQVTPTENLAPSSHHVPPALRNPDGTLKGDMDGKGRLTAKDAEGALQMSVGLRPVDMNLDVDKDGRVMSADARLILQGATGMMGQ